MGNATSSASWLKFYAQETSMHLYLCEAYYTEEDKEEGKLFCGCHMLLT